MKSKLLFAGLITLGLTSKAQFGEKGQRLITAGLTANSTSSSGTGATSSNASGLNVNLSLGKFNKQHVLTNFTVYGGFFDNENEDQSTFYNTKGHNFGAAFSKTFYKPVVKNLFVGLGGAAGINYSSSEYSSSASGVPVTTTKQYGVGISLVPSLSYQFSKRFVANITPGNSFLRIDYSYADIKRKSPGIAATNSKQNGVALTAGFWSAPLQNLGISFSYMLKKK